MNIFHCYSNLRNFQLLQQNEFFSEKLKSSALKEWRKSASCTSSYRNKRRDAQFVQFCFFIILLFSCSGAGWLVYSIGQFLTCIFIFSFRSRFRSQFSFVLPLTVDKLHQSNRLQSVESILTHYKQTHNLLPSFFLVFFYLFSGFVFSPVLLNIKRFFFQVISGVRFKWMLFHFIPPCFSSTLFCNKFCNSMVSVHASWTVNDIRRFFQTWKEFRESHLRHSRQSGFIFYIYYIWVFIIKFMPHPQRWSGRQRE